MVRVLALAAAVLALTLGGCASVQPEDATNLPMPYACPGGKSFTAAFAKDGRRATVVAAGQTYVLAVSQVNDSVGGMKFMRNGVVLHAKGPVAALEGAAGGPYRDCRTG
jgi:hypothetical protein